MKYITAISICIICALVLLGISGKTPTTSHANSDFLRIHIRANSNTVEDQQIKYKVKDLILQEMTPEIAKCNSKSQVIELLNENNDYLSAMVNDFLHSNGFDYSCNILIKSEYFPVRSYDQNITLQSGVYDAIIVELGESIGNNWWCVAYPPLCFVDYQPNAQVIYKSKLVEIINNFFNGR